MKRLTYKDRIRCCTLRMRGYSIRAIGITLGLPPAAVAEYLNSRPSAELHVKEVERS